MDVFSDFKQILADFTMLLRQKLTLQIVVTLVASLVVLIIGLFVLHRKASIEHVSRRVKRAQAMGHVLTAHCVKSWVMTDDRLDVNAKVNAIYEYSYDNKIYHYHYLEKKAPAATIQLYYLKNPKRAFIQKNRSYLRGLAVFASTILAGAVAALLTR